MLIYIPPHADGELLVYMESGSFASGRRLCLHFGVRVFNLPQVVSLRQDRW